MEHPPGVEPSSSGRQPDIMSRYTTRPYGRNYWLCSSVSALSARRSAIELSSYDGGQGRTRTYKFSQRRRVYSPLDSPILRTCPNGAQQRCLSPHRTVLIAFEAGLQAAAVCCAYGTLCRTRTRTLPVRSRTLYPVEPTGCKAPCTGFEPASLPANGFQDRSLTARTHGISGSPDG